MNTYLIEYKTYGSKLVHVEFTRGYSTLEAIKSLQKQYRRSLLILSIKKAKNV